MDDLEELTNSPFGRMIQPSEWLRVASDLLHASHAIADEAERCLQAALEQPRPFSAIHCLFCMQVGFAIENIVKGWFLENDVSYFLIADRKSIKSGPGGPNPLWKNGHNVAELAKQTGMPLSEADRSLLAAITDCVIWVGRYPIPTSAGPLTGDHPVHVLAKRIGAGGIDAVKNLVVRLVGYLWKMGQPSLRIPSGWGPPLV